MHGRVINLRAALMGSIHRRGMKQRRWIKYVRHCPLMTRPNKALILIERHWLYLDLDLKK